MRRKVTPVGSLSGVISVPGDKSISHRAVMLGALAEGITEIEGFLTSADCLHTLQCMRSLGVSIEGGSGLAPDIFPRKQSGQKKNQEKSQEKVKESLEEKIFIQGKGLWGLREPEGFLDVGNSGTTIRLLSGILAGQPFTSFLTGDASLCARPMQRVIIPLKEMGAQIIARRGGTLAPLGIAGGNLRSIIYKTPVASAQVKSAVLLAGLFASGWTEVVEPAVSRNHTELMLEAFGAKVEKEDNSVRVKGLPKLQAQKVAVPGDLSSAAFFLVAALIVPSGKILLRSVGLNPTRSGIIEVLQAMGAKIRVFDVQEIAGELRGSIEVESSALQGVSLGGEIIPRLIDEIPIIAVAGLFARGITEIREAAELKVKESNRLAAMCQGLTRIGGRVEELPDGLRIYGGYPLQGACCQSFGDHRIAMALAVAALRAKGETVIEDAEAVDISFPGFWGLLEELRGGSRC